VSSIVPKEYMLLIPEKDISWVAKNIFERHYFFQEDLNIFGPINEYYSINEEWELVNGESWGMPEKLIVMNTNFELVFDIISLNASHSDASKYKINFCDYDFQVEPAYEALYLRVDYFAMLSLLDEMGAQEIHIYNLPRLSKTLFKEDWKWVIFQRILRIRNVKIVDMVVEP
jgi:hypothetical protein